MRKMFILECYRCDNKVERCNAIKRVCCFKCKEQKNKLCNNLRLKLKNGLISKSEYNARRKMIVSGEHASSFI